VVKAGAGFVRVVVVAAVVLGTASSSLTAGCGGLVVVVAGGCGWWARRRHRWVVLVDVVDVEVGVVVRRASLPSTTLGVRASVVSAQRGALTCHGRRRRPVHVHTWDLERF